MQIGDCYWLEHPKISSTFCESSFQDLPKYLQSNCWNCLLWIVFFKALSISMRPIFAGTFYGCKGVDFESMTGKRGPGKGNWLQKRPRHSSSHMICVTYILDGNLFFLYKPGDKTRFKIVESHQDIFGAWSHESETFWQGLPSGCKEDVTKEWFRSWMTRYKTVVWCTAFVYRLCFLQALIARFVLWHGSRHVHGIPFYTKENREVWMSRYQPF